MARKRGFTLVELLVVIGIIALLISILLPSLARARQAAVTLQCLSNLRTIGQGFVLYQQDNKGCYPYGMRSNPGLNYYMAWPSIVSRYLGATESNLSPFNNVPGNGSMGVFMCPARVVEVPNPADLHSTYVGHPIVLSSSEFVNWSNYYANSPAKTAYPEPAWAYKAVWMKDASNKVVVMDGSQLLPDAVSENGYTWPVGQRMDMDSAGIYLLYGKTGMTESPTVAGFDYNQPCYIANNNQDVTNRNNTSSRFRHGGDTQCNFLFGDGHAETRSYNRGTGQTDLTHANFSVNFPIK